MPTAPTALTDQFRDNLRRLMEADRQLHSQPRLAAASRVAQTSIGRILRGEQSPTLDMVHKLATAFGLEAWQMLVPDLEPDNPPITKQIDERQHELLKRFRLAAQDLARYEVEAATPSRKK
jgi:transcriptional regulator with XRE-family HTH domain